jgi:hypothetical protein
VVPFRWNAAQVKLHAILERQLEARGLVRALILKARRLGISTYVGARFYRRTTLWPGYRSFILTHEDPATQTLFDMVKRMHANMPADYRHDLLVANENELDFDGIDAGYRIGTAKNVKGRGRGGTLQLFHGSEVAFWPHAEGHFAGAIQSVSLVSGTEVILESTANGVGGTFYEQWGLAEAKQSDFIAVFLPWMIDPDHVRPISEDYEPSEDEREFQRLYRLTEEQLCWAHFKNIELGGQPGELCGMFKQEYPATSAEAFQTTGTDSFIPAEAILRARRFKAPNQSHMPRVLGVDVARGGKDRTRLVDRRGRKAGTIDEAMHTDDLVQVANRVAQGAGRQPRHPQGLHRHHRARLGRLRHPAQQRPRRTRRWRELRLQGAGAGEVRRPPRRDARPHQGMVPRSGRRRDPRQRHRPPAHRGVGVLLRHQLAPAHRGEDRHQEAPRLLARLAGRARADLRRHPADRHAGRASEVDARPGRRGRRQRRHKAVDTLDVTTLKIGGTAVTATAAEINAISGGGLSAAELGVLDGVTAGTVTASKAVVVSSGKALTGMGGITFDDVANFAFSTSFGSRFGTTQTQKMGWWGAGPAAQPAVLAAITVTQPTATVFGFTTTAQFNLLIAAVNQLIANQKTVGFMATA